MQALNPDVVVDVLTLTLKALGHDISTILRTADYYANCTVKNVGDRYGGLPSLATFLAFL